MNSFSNLKRNSGNLDKLAKALESLINTDTKDSRDNYWKCSLDKSSNGLATIRFLPAPAVDGDDALPWVKIFSHGFQGPAGQWFIEQCLTTKNEACPTCESNSELWNSGIDANKSIARDRKRKLSYVANIYVVSDPKNPENEGKVFLFKFGKKIFEKITEAMNPQFPDESPINPFDFWTGANFRLKVRKLDGYINYDKSEFESSSPMLNDDEQLEKIWKSEHSLQELISDKEFKSYDDLKNRLDRVLGLSGDVRPKTTVEQIKESAPKTRPPAEDAPWQDTSTNEDDDDMAYFSKLASED